VRRALLLWLVFFAAYAATAGLPASPGRDLSEPEAQSLLVAESKDPSRSGRVDVVGALLSALGFGGVVFGLIEGRTYGWFTSLTPLTIGSWSWPWSLSPVPVAMVVGVAALVVFVLLERRKQRRGEAGMLDLALFAIPSFRNGNIAAAIVSLGEFGIIFALPLWLQNVVGYTAFQTNGRQYFSAGGREFNVEAAVPGMVAGIDVYKNPSAEHIEGGIGGLVNVRTRRPSDFKPQKHEQKITTVPYPPGGRKF